MNRKLQCLYRSSLRSLTRMSVVLAALSFVFVFGCGGGSSSSDSNTNPPPASSTALQINMGDAPVDWIVSLSIKVSSMSLTRTGASAVTVSDTSTPIELISRLGTMEPVALVSVPQGSYSGANMTIASWTIAYLDPETGLQQKTIEGPINVSVPFSSSVTVGTTPLAFNFDLDLLHSISGETGSAFQLSPQFHFSLGTSSSANGNGMNARNGGMYQLMGVVTSTSSSGSFTVQALQSMSTYTFMVNTQTQFRGKVANMAQIAKGMGVLVTAALQTDGTLLAKRVRATMSSGGAMGGGVITEVTTLPESSAASSLTIVMQNGAGASINTDYLSKTLTVNLTGSTTYDIDNDRVDLTGLPFTPTFNASNIYAGQTVLPLSDGEITLNPSCDPTCGTMTASAVILRERGFRGTTTVAITPGAITSFTLTLPTDCAFTTLTGATEILVYQQASTNVEDNQTITAGSTLRVHGLPFKVGDQWVLVASTIAATT